MNAAQQRNEVCCLAKQDPRKALEKAREIQDPWFKAQSLAWVVRYTDGNPKKIAIEVAEAARQGDDEYKRTAVRAWGIAALADRGHRSEARKKLKGAIASSKSVTPPASRAEALLLILRASFRIDHKAAEMVADELESGCGDDPHWRCKRAIKYADELLRGEYAPRLFFW